MTAICLGFEIVCPDGVVRHYPYHNEGDADCDAGVYEKRGCGTTDFDRLPLDDPRGACPQGPHTVRVIAITHIEHHEHGEGDD